MVVFLRRRIGRNAPSTTCPRLRKTTPVQMKIAHGLGPVKVKITDGLRPVKMEMEVEKKVSTRRMSG